MNLFEIKENIRQVMENGFAYDEESGEITFETKDLDTLQEAFETKAEAVALFIKELKAEAEVIKNEKMQLAKRQQVKENKVEYLTEYLTSMLEGNKFETPKVAVSYRKSQKVVCDDLNVVSDEYLRFKEPELDKTKVKEAIKRGEIVDGVRLEDSVSTIVK